METQKTTEERIEKGELGKIEKTFETYCPRCEKMGYVVKTTTHFLTLCKNCQFSMGQLRDLNYKE